MKPKYYTTSFTCLKVHTFPYEKILKLQKIMPPNIDNIKKTIINVHCTLSFKEIPPKDIANFVK
jgi:hypothetical protein